MKNNAGESPEGRCFPNSYSYCSPYGKFKLSGPESIIGRSVIVLNEKDAGNSGGSEFADPIACGTIGIDIFDVSNIDLLPANVNDETGNPCPWKQATQKWDLVQEIS